MINQTQRFGRLRLITSSIRAHRGEVTSDLRRFPASAGSISRFFERERGFADSPGEGTGSELPVAAPAKVLSGGESGCWHDNRSPYGQVSAGSGARRASDACPL